MTSDSPHLRMGVLGVVAISLFAALFSRLWFLQVMSAPTFAVAAQENRERVVPIAPVRGRILDREGRVLGGQPQLERGDGRSRGGRGRDRRGVPLRPARQGARRDRRPISKHRFNDRRYSPLLPVPLAEDVPEATVVHIAERGDLFPGVEAKEVAVRVYPYGSRAAHVIGYIGALSDTEFESLEVAGLLARGSARQGRRREDLREGPPRHARLDHSRGGLARARAAASSRAPTPFPAAICS